MSSLRRRILLRAAKLFDVVLMVFSFGLATMLVAHQTAAVSLAEFLSMRIKVGNFVIFALFLLAWHVLFSSLGLYGSRRISSRWAEVFDFAKATTLGSVIVLVAAASLRIALVTPFFILIFWAASTLTGAASRMLFRSLLAGVRRRGRNLRQMVVVGTNPRALRFARKIESRPELGYRIAGFVDGPWLGLGMFRQTGYPLVSDLASFPSFLREQVVDEVVIALPMESSYGKAARIAALCEEQGIIVRLLSSMFNLRLAQSRAEEFAGEAVTTLSTGSPDGWQHLLKRTLDVAVSLAAMLALSPVFLLAALVRGPSPRAWGLPENPANIRPVVRTIPTRVGITKPRRDRYPSKTDHPHARGDYPPRSASRVQEPDHPHARGDYPLDYCRSAKGHRPGQSGPSPRAWG